MLHIINVYMIRELVPFLCVFNKRGLYIHISAMDIRFHSIPIRLAKPIVIFETKKNCFIIIWSPVKANYLAATLPACIHSKNMCTGKGRKNVFRGGWTGGSFMYHKIRCENRTGSTSNTNTKWKSNEFSVRTNTIICRCISKIRKLFSFFMPTVEINAHFVEYFEFIPML